MLLPTTFPASRLVPGITEESRVEGRAVGTSEIHQKTHSTPAARACSAVARTVVNAAAAPRVAEGV
jgi:hypothetical protein